MRLSMERIQVLFWSALIAWMTRAPGLSKGVLKANHMMAVYRFSSLLRLAFLVSMLGLGLLGGFGLIELAGAGSAGTPIAAEQDRPPGSSEKLLPAVNPSLPGNPQRTLLVIGVDDLRQTEPRLESLWMVLYLTGQPQITFLPVYPPVPDGGGRRETESLAGHFELASDRRLAPGFVADLQNRNLRWTNSVLIDETALEALLRLANREADGNAGGARQVSQISKAWEDDQEALVGQLSLVQEICAQSANLAPSAGIASLLELIPDHFVTDLDMEEAIADWRGFYSGRHRFSCDFPTLSALAGSGP